MLLVILEVGVGGGYSENNKIIFTFCLCSVSESEIKCFLWHDGFSLDVICPCDLLILKKI